MLTVITGPMFSGKSIELIKQVNRHKVAGRHVIVFNYAADNRYAHAAAASYDGLSTWAVPVTSAEDVEQRLDKLHEVVVIDEVQFFDDGIIDLIERLVREGREVVAAGLNLDFRGKAFAFRDGTRTMADLVVQADAIILLQAICTAVFEGKICGAPATRTQRLRDGQPVAASDPLMQIGTEDSYEAHCVAHHIVAPSV